MTDRPELPKVALGFEAAHEEWLSQGSHEFKKPFRFGAPKEFYATQYWKLVRQATLERDCFKCYRCGKQANQVHHLRYDFIGEDHLHTETLVSICPGCHGMVEYGRNAQELVRNRIRPRISSCQGFVEGRRGCRDQNPVKAFSRLLEYRYELAELERLYETQIPYSNKRLGTGIKKELDRWATKLSRHNNQVEEGKTFLAKLHQKGAEYQRLATVEVSAWTGSEEDKTSRIIPLLEREVEKCLEFANKVVQPLAK